MEKSKEFNAGWAACYDRVMLLLEECGGRSYEKAIEILEESMKDEEGNLLPPLEQ